jgi:hypothetical protein
MKTKPFSNRIRFVHQSLLALILTLSVPVGLYADTYSADVVIYGATSGGIMSAVQAVKEGKTVELIATTKEKSSNNRMQAIPNGPPKATHS